MTGRAARRVLALATALGAVLATGDAQAGYTHYWRWRAPPDPAALGRCVDDMSRLADARRDLLVDAHGRTGAAAVFRDTQTFAFPDAGPGTSVPAIVFNGIGDLGHETFGFPLAPFTQDDASFQFVKTAAKPYDVVAAACLIVARDCFPREVLAITSDGTWPASFADGAALYERTFGRRAKNPLDPPAAVAPPPPSTPGNDASVVTSPPRGGPPRRTVLLGVIALLALAIVFVMTRETRA